MSMLVDEDERPEHDGEPPLRCTMVLCPGAMLLSTGPGGRYGSRH